MIVVALEKALAAEVPNLQLLHIDGGTVTDYFEDGEVDRIYLNFSDHGLRNVMRRDVNPCLFF